MLHRKTDALKPRPMNVTAPFVVLVAWLGLVLAGCNGADSPSKPAPGGGQDQAASQSAETPEAIELPQEAAVDPEDLLRRVAAAYKQAETYADAGRVCLTAEVDQAKQERVANFAVTLKRPRQLHLEAYEATVICDGKTFRAALNDLPDQVLQRPAPQELTLRDLGYDEILTKALADGMAGAFAGSPPQLTLLLAEDPVAMLLRGVDKSTVIEPGTVEGRPCFRVQVERPDGQGVFWIDQETLALRRLEFPTDAMRQMLARSGGTVGAVSLVADFAGAQFNQPVDPVAFQLAVPQGADVVEFFIPPHPAQLLGSIVPEFQLVSLEGKPITRDSLAGKVTVLAFWASSWKPSLDSLQEVARVQSALGERQDVHWMAASVDPPEVDAKSLQDALDKRNVRLTMVRDPKQQWNQVFNGGGQLPLIVLIDAEGIVQDYHILDQPGADTDLAAKLMEKIGKLLAGEDIYETPLAEYQRKLDEYGEWLKQRAEQSPGETATAELEIPRAEVAKRSQPQNLRLAPLWKNTDLESPGNLAVLRGADGQDRLLVIEDWRKIAEVGLDGKIVARHDLDIDPKETVTKLRTGVDRSGRLFVAAFASSEQRVHLLDGSFQKLFSFPENALENPHQGISDVTLADLDDDGTLEAYVGYWGVVGLQRVGLDGKRVWSNRQVADVSRLAVGPGEASGQPALYCTNSSGALARVNAAGKLLDQLSIRNRGLHWAVAADLGGPGQPQWCGLAATPEHRSIAVGFDTEGKELWTYPLPLGVHERAIEEIVAGRLMPGRVGQWILPGGDGSIHIISPDGKLIDRFNYGARLTGLATAELDGRGVLVVATDKTLEAWSVQ